MMKKILKLSVSFILLGLGFYIGFWIYSLQWKCLDFAYGHHPFYGVFEKELANAMYKRGYIRQCPNILPRTKVYFYITHRHKPQPYAEKNSLTKKIAFISDCHITELDIEYLRQFDVLLNVNPFNNGYLSSFNFRTAHFPLTNQDANYCQAKYSDFQINIPLLAERLDAIIQGARHEKF